MDTVPVTREGYVKLKNEIRELEAERPRILMAIKEAREKGDLKENAEYHAAREEQGMLEAKLDQVRSKLSRAQVVNMSQAPEGTAAFGCSVRVYNEMFEEEETYELVGEGEADPRNNRILTTSPIGRALLTQKVGDEVEAEVPGGLMRMKILEIIR